MTELDMMVESINALGREVERLKAQLRGTSQPHPECEGCYDLMQERGLLIQALHKCEDNPGEVKAIVKKVLEDLS